MQGQGGCGGALVEFSFTSWAMRDLPEAVRLRIARQAWDFNTRAGLTGELRYEGGRFRQVIEGPCETVLPLASRILTDSRHGGIAVRAFRPIATRRFATWNAIGFEHRVFAASCSAAVVQTLRVLPSGLAEARELSAKGARIG
jgi:hypothetical protein